MPTFEESVIRRDSSGKFAEKPAAESGHSLSEAEIDDWYSPSERKEMAEAKASLDATASARRLVDEPDDPGRAQTYQPSDDFLDSDYDPMRSAIARSKAKEETPKPAVSSRGFDGQRRDFNQELQDYLQRNGLGEIVPAVEPDERTPPRSGWFSRRREARAARQREIEAVAASWQRTRDRHETISVEHAEHEADVLAVLDRPTLTDLSEPTTERLYRALVAASDLRTDRTPDAAGTKAYAAAVTELDVTWRSANQHADRVRLAGFGPAERRRITQARALMSKALDDAATPAERQSCYAKAMEMLEGLVPVPKPAAKAVETRTALALGS